MKRTKVTKTVDGKETFLVSPSYKVKKNRVGVWHSNRYVDMLAKKKKMDEFDFYRKKYQNVCLFCKKPIAVLCGTPIIMLGGCCYGWRTKKVFYCFPRRAHLHCWLKNVGLKIVEVEK